MKKFFIVLVFTLFVANLCAEVLMPIKSLNRNDRRETSLSVTDSREDSGAIFTKHIKVKTRNGTVHFEIHAKEKSFIYAERVARILKNDSLHILNYFKYKPTTNINFTLNTSATRANGTAGVFPSNIINLYVQPPVGKSHLNTGEDWLKILVLHELTHVVHLDQTAGFTNVLRHIFGSLGKLGQFVPRWFAEGVAVWAESHFTKGGRLNNPEFVWELESRLQDPNFCQTMDCFDSPGEYPYGSYAYWIGGHFLKYLEDKKPGTMQCLVRINSRKFLFLLNSAFQYCTGKKAEHWFEKYKLAKKSEFRKRKKRLLNNPLYGNLEKIKFKTSEHPHLQTNYEVVGDKLFVATVENQIQYLKEYSLENNKSISHRLDVVIDQMSKEDDKKLLITHSLFDRLETQREAGIFKDGELKEIDNLKGDYFFTYKGRKYSLVYKKFRWQIVEQNKKRPIYFFPYLVGISFSQHISNSSGEHLRLHVFDQNSSRPFQIWSYDLKQKNTEILYQSKNNVKLLGQCENQSVLLDDAKNFIVLGQTKLDQVQVQLVKAPWANQVVSFRGSDSHSVFLLKDDPGTFYHSDKSCTTLINDLVKEVDKTNVITTKSITKKKPKTMRGKNLESYPSLRHFKPHWWFFSVLATEGTTELSVFTTLNDPKNVHSLDLNLSYYTDYSEVSPDFTYAYDMGFAHIGLGRAKAYEDNSINSTPDESEVNFAFMSKSETFHRFSWNGSLMIRNTDEVDVAGNRRTNGGFLNNSLFVASAFDDSFFQGLLASSSVGYVDVESSESFIKQGYSAKMNYQPLRNVFLNFKSTYATSDTNRLSNGVTFAGGGYDTGSVYHGSYGVDENDAFGLDVFTYKAELQVEFLKLHRGVFSKAFFPVFFRSFDIFGGMDYLKTDFIYLEDIKSFIRDSDLKTWYVGIKNKIDIFYRLPISLDFVYAQPRKSGYSLDSRFQLFLNSSLSF